jgi:hypothetical protein
MDKNEGSSKIKQLEKNREQVEKEMNEFSRCLDLLEKTESLIAYCDSLLEKEGEK